MGGTGLSRIRTERYRLLPETQAKVQMLRGIAGACRAIWNCWLQEYPASVVRYILKHLADAYQAAFKGDKGWPRFKSRRRTRPVFTIPQYVKIQKGQLWVPTVGWVPIRGAGYHAHGAPRQVRVIMEGTKSKPKWYAYVAYAVPASAVKQGAPEGIVGLDCNVGQTTDSDGTLYPMTDTKALTAKLKRKQREQARKVQGSVRHRRLGDQITKLYRKIKWIRDNDTHRISRAIADKARTVVGEGLKAKSMTRSARGTVDNPGTYVRQKAGLNRVILGSNWSRLWQRLAYKCGETHQVDPAYTSQICHRCGFIHQDNRKRQAEFKCLACGWELNADHNAAVNILARHIDNTARGKGAVNARREVFLLGTAVTREQGMPACSGIQFPKICTCTLAVLR